MSHSGQELELLLKGKKAMAAFCRLTNENFDEMGGQDFDHYVERGRLHRGRFFVENENRKRMVYTVFYTPVHRWRFDLYRSLKKSIRDGWNTDKELIESILLDYDKRSIGEYLRLLSIGRG